MNKNTLKQYEDIAIDINDSHIKTYINFKMLHLETFKKEISNIKSYLIMRNIPDEYTHSNYKSFLYKLYKYEKEHQYKYTKEKGYKSVAAIRIEILLPKKINTSTLQKKFVVQYVKECNPVGYKLPWISYIITRKDSKYLVILLSEREYQDCEVVDTYNRNYKNKEGLLVHEKGSPRLDSNGNQIKKHVLWSNKVRIFTFSKFKCFEIFMNDLKDKLIMVLKSTIGKIERKFIMKKRNAKKIWHFYNGKCVIEVNHVKKYIECMCNFALDIQRSKKNSRYNDDDDREKSSPTPLYKEISNLFFKYKKRFDKESFHDNEKVLREIAYKNVALDVLQENLYILKEQFNQDLIKLVPVVFN